MTLFQKLQQAKSEEDVKDIYIKALGLKSYSKNLIDIQTDEVWFEAKEGYNLSTYAMFTQLLHYVYRAWDKGEHLPPFLAVVDTQKAAIVKTADMIPLLVKRNIKWGKRASDITPQALETVSQFIGTYLVSFKIETHGEEFVNTLKDAIKKGKIIRRPITPDNLKQVFDKWVEKIGREISGVKDEDYALLFFADVMSDGTVATHKDLPAQLIHKNNSPAFLMYGKLYELGSVKGIGSSGQSITARR